MKPPESPAPRRAVGRTRTKSMSNQGTTAAADSPQRARRRSSSLRGLQDHALPTVPEKAEDADAQTEKEKEQAAAKAKFEVEEAQRLEAKRREEEAAMAEAKRVEEEEAAKRAAEEERQAAERAKQEEEERKQREEQRRKEIEMDAARRNYRGDVLAALPLPLARFLDDTQERLPEEQARKKLLEMCTPLLVVEEYDGEDWLLNIQAAPLLGARGLELLLTPPEPIGFTRTFCEGWQTRDVPPGILHQRAEYVVHALAVASYSPATHLDPGASFEALLKRTSDRLYAIEAMEKKMLNGTITLELVRRSDVLADLDPALVVSPIEVQRLALPKAAAAVQAELDKEEKKQSSVQRMAEHWDKAPLKRTYVGGEEQQVKRAKIGKTKVVVVHEK